VPTHSEDYVHRIGRTGRAGRSGTAVTLATDEDRKYLDQIETLIGKKIDWEGPGLDELPPPDETPRSPRGRSRGERGERAAHSRRAEPAPRRPRRSEEAEAPRRPRRVEDAEAPRRPSRRIEAERPPAYGDRRDRRPRPPEDDGPPVVGLGDHIPSFLLRPVVLKPAKVGEE
jgi:superfamily II DNA/RNA helicase